MITVKLNNCDTNKAGAVVQVLGGRTLLYRTAPLTIKAHVAEVVKEFVDNSADCILFDAAALPDAESLELSQLAVERIQKRRNGKALKVVLFNFPNL